MNFFRKIKTKLQLVDKYTKNYIAHNKSIFLNQAKNLKRNKSVILIELNEQHSSHIAYSYFATALADKHDAKVVGYLPEYTDSFLKVWIKKFFLKINSTTKVYTSFGATQFLVPTLLAREKSKVDIIFDNVLREIHEKKDIESICIEGVWIGDLIYDSYLMHNKMPTIDKEAKNFLATLRHAIELYVFWERYISKNDVKAICLSHCVYFQAIPLRVAVTKKIPVYQVNATHAYLLDEKNLFAYNDFFDFPMRFASLPSNKQKSGLKAAQERIEQRFAGAVGVDMTYSKKSAYGQFKHERLLKESDRTKVLIATHCFFDAPHPYGKNLFPDFYEWLDFLGRISEKTDYDWYIKTHPDYLEGTKNIIDTFVQKYPKFICLPPDSSHHQIIAESLDVALTVYGTIGFEYAALGIPVVNASTNNPHIAYDFNIHPKSINEYENILMNLDKIEIEIDKTKIYEYYYMKHIFNTENWLFKDYHKLIFQIGAYQNQFTSLIYEKWMDEYSDLNHVNLIQSVKRFINSENFRLDHRHTHTLQ